MSGSDGVDEEAARVSSASPDAAPRRHITVREAAFIGVGSMVGAGIFSLLGAAGEVAGAAVWISFLLAGVVAGLQGYSFAKLGARYPSAGGLLEYVNRGFGRGHAANTVAWLTYAVNCIITAMVAVSFGSYASSLFANDNAAWAEAFALAIVVLMTLVNIAGSTWVARLQSAIVFVVVGILCVFSIVTIVNMDPSLLAPKDYPGLKDIVSSVALTFFAFLGFGIITFTAKDLAKPKKQLPRAMYIALGIATVIYVAVSVGVFGTLTVPAVIAAGPTAIAEAAKPTLGQFGFVLMGVTALFSTTGATNAGLYPATGLSEQLAADGQFPPIMGRRIGGRANFGLLTQAALILVMVASFDLSAIASIGSAVALMIFVLITVGHFRVRSDTGASAFVLGLALLTAAVSLITFVVTDLIHELAAIWTLVGIVVLSIVLDQWWSRKRDRAAPAPA